LEERRKGGNRRKLTDEQEANILEKFREKAEKGQVVSLLMLKGEYDKVRGIETANSTFYDFLNRMQWRRVMPRGAHPKKASDEVIEASKKLTLS
jgi:transposase